MVTNEKMEVRDMFNSKYSNVLTVLLVIVIIFIIGLIGFLGYDFYRKYYIDKEAQEFMSQYEEQFPNTVEENVITDDNTIVIDPVNEVSQNTTNNTGSSVKKNNKPTYKGFYVLGTIEIPKTGIKYPILEKETTKSLEVAVAYYYGPGLNQVGNTTIAGHNYRNGAFFGKNKQLSNGDIIYITDNSGQKVKYTIYNIYKTTPDDANYITRDTHGAREISLTTCTDDSKGRLIIWAKE